MSTQFGVVVEPLSDAERAELAAIEIAIEDSLRGFEAMASRLKRVRDGRLYRENHVTFEDYCRVKWGFVASRARQIVAGAEATESVTKVTLPAPASERVARVLVPLSETERREVWAEAVDEFGDTPTAAQTREVAQRHLPAPPPRKDMRFELIEDAVATLQDLPDPSAIRWPVDEQGDIEMVDEAFAWLDAWLPKARASWRAHKAAVVAARKAEWARGRARP